MPTQIYKNAAGKRLPSVTTILSRWKESGGLVHWAWSLGIEGKDYREAREAAANSGTVVHEMIDLYFGGNDPFAVRCDDAATIEAAKRGFDSFAKWVDQSKLKILERETPLISEELQCGGTPDAIGEINGELVLIDWKSSNAVYSDHLLQVAAYKMMWEENHPGQKITGGFHLCRFSKEHADFAHRYFSELDGALDLFKLFRRAYDLDKVVKKRVG